MECTLKIVMDNGPYNDVLDAKEPHEINLFCPPNTLQLEASNRQPVLHCWFLYKLRQSFLEANKAVSKQGHFSQ